jgi:hypothetical protein
MRKHKEKLTQNLIEEIILKYKDCINVIISWIHIIRVNPTTHICQKNIIIYIYVKYMAKSPSGRELKKTIIDAPPYPNYNPNPNNNLMPKWLLGASFDQPTTYIYSPSY